jgi:hypothetical protein
VGAVACTSAAFSLKSGQATTHDGEDARSGPPIIGTLYVQQWTLRKLTGDNLPEHARVTVTVDK